jgi:hypothetical protein
MIEALLSVLPAQPGGPWDVIADLGRITSGRLVAGDWLERSDVAVIVVRGDAPSILHVKERATAIRRQSGGRVCLAVVGASRYSNAEIEEFTGVTVAGNLPFEPGVAAVATGEGGSPRRLSRSLLVGSASRLAKALSGADQEPDEATGPMGAQLPLPIPVQRSPLERIRGSLRVGQFVHSRRPGSDGSSATEVAEVTKVTESVEVAEVTEVPGVEPAAEKSHVGAHL